MVAGEITTQAKLDYEKAQDLIASEVSGSVWPGGAWCRGTNRLRQPLDYEKKNIWIMIYLYDIEMDWDV